MTYPDNSQFSEEERTEVFRRQVMQQLMSQSRALDTIRSIMVVWVVLTVIGAIIIVAASASRY